MSEQHGVKLFPQGYAQGYQHEVDRMGTATAEFLPGELVVVGGDYGEILLAGTSPAARQSIEQVIGATRCRPDGTKCQLVVTYDDSASTFFEDRNAGREGSTYDRSDEQPWLEGGAATPSPTNGTD